MLWSNLFQCGIPHIDAQHRALFEHVERLGSMHGDVSRIPETVDFLETYTDQHFTDEESLHQQTRYPRALEHRRMHQGFIQSLRKLKTDYLASGHNLSILMEMNHAIIAWLKEHILDADKAFAAFYHTLPEEKKRGLRLPHRPWIPESSQMSHAATTDVRPEGPAGTDAEAAARRFGGSWSDALLCGIPAIDEQHKELFRQLDILRDRGNRERVPGILRFLADYVVKHFKDEESLHIKSAYPGALEHRKLHEGFARIFMELKAKHDASADAPAVVMEINRVVYDWLKEHVMRNDKLFAKYYLAQSDQEAGGD